MTKKMMTVFVLLLLAAVSPAQIVMPNAIGSGGGGGSIGSGSTVTSCTSSILTASAASLLACDPAAVVNGSVSTAGRSILTIRDTITGASSDSNFLNVTGMLPVLSTTEVNGGKFLITTSASDTTGVNGRYGFRVELRPETAGSGKNGSANVGVYAFSSAETTATLLTRATQGFQGSAGQAAASGTTLLFGAIGATNGQASIGNVGVWGHTGQGTAPINGIGVMGEANAGSNTNIGGYFKIGTSVLNVWPTTGPSAALIAENSVSTSDIFRAQDNGAATSTTGASANVTILDGAQMRLGNQVLTGSTMTPTIVGEVRTVTHSYAWTNAMLVALGASLTGDVNVAVLPAKTQVKNAFIVIDTPGTDANTLTVSCGDTGAGAVNYVKAGDAKAAANTVYGDNITGSETGTSLFSTFFITNYVPSYTATTTISCRFTKTVANLSTQTGSTGRVILTTTLLP